MSSRILRHFHDREFYKANSTLQPLACSLPLIFPVSSFLSFFLEEFRMAFSTLRRVMCKCTVGKPFAMSPLSVLTRDVSYT